MGLAVPSSANADRTLTLSSASRTATWEAAPSAWLDVVPAVNLVRCADPVVMCDETLLKVAAPGGLSVEVRHHIGPYEPPYVGFRVRVYRSDVDGARGPVVAESHDYSKAATVSRAGLTSDYYLVELSWSQGAGGFTARATLTPRAAQRQR
jgi:hypothetical protein